MSFVVDTVGKITLPDGDEVQGVILVGSADDVREAAKFWAGRVKLVSAEEPTKPRPVHMPRDFSAEKAIREAGRGHLLGD
ncbi:hypothetical protein [Actibacterium sp. MT2.3-13A]|uniref:hypothetical protein n=1 Tax=Actibacterium sp. MT2.3-13A TaxID=2828332 RepID=UPI001BA463C8|nr:hypothetical protein [Actibacterium sp. MT2.3-13A]